MDQVHTRHMHTPSTCKRDACNEAEISQGAALPSRMDTLATSIAPLHCSLDMTAGKTQLQTLARILSIAWQLEI